MTITGELINGLVFGLEHIQGEKEDEIAYLILIHFLVFRFCLIKLK